MGGSSEDSSTDEDHEVAERAADAKSSREANFSRYNNQQKYSKKQEKAGKTATPVSRPSSAVVSNMNLAQDFEMMAKESKINVPGTTGIALSTIQSINYNNIASGLRGGGYAVTNSKDGSVQGVVNNGRYSGNLGFSPIGRSKGASFNNVTQQYSVEQGQEPSGENDSQQTNNTPSRTQTTSINKTDSTTSLSTATRRSLITGGGPDAKRRIFTV